jgi:phosphopantothenoylcysteine decarboxylase/phosphopantothenate--cysteine ligase
MGLHCIVTAGPTYESLDEVRRLTNFSTGKLGTLLADYLTRHGHSVTLLRGYYSTWQGEVRVQRLFLFTTTEDLRCQLAQLSKTRVHAVFHAAAVSDFRFGNVFRKRPDGSLARLRSGKYSTRHGTLLAELVPTPKILRELRGWYPGAFLAGWKYEVDGGRRGSLKQARAQIEENHTDASVANGPAYGNGFGVITGGDQEVHASDHIALFKVLEKLCALKHTG